MSLLSLPLRSMGICVVEGHTLYLSEYSFRYELVCSMQLLRFMVLYVKVFKNC